MALAKFDESGISCESNKTRNWNAWLVEKGSKPHPLHVIGEVEVSNLGVRAILVKKIPQGVNPSYLLLDMHLIQRPGIWPQVISWVPAQYDEMTEVEYQIVNVFCGKELKAEVPVVVAR